MEKKLFTVAMILLLSLGILTVLKMNVTKAAPFVSLQDAEIATQMSDLHFGTAKNVVVVDVPGSGVRVTFDPNVNGVQDKLGFGDDFPVSPLAGGASAKGHDGDFSGYTAYKMTFTNNGAQTVTVCLFMDTGYTNGGANPELDTFWQGDWIDVAPGGSATAILDFSSATVYHAGDDPVFTHYTDGTTGVAIWRLDEVSKIGFQILSSVSADVVLSDVTRLYVDPAVSTKYYDVDSFFDVYVRIEGVNDFYGVDIDLRWDNALMTYNTEDYTTYLTAMWGSGTWAVTTDIHGVVSGEGYYRFIAVCTHVPPGFSTSGNQAIFKLTFNVLDPDTNSKETGSIHFATDKLSDSNAQPIIHTTEDGTYEVWGQTPTIDMTHATGYSRTCREVNEPFMITVGISNAVNLAGFEFEIHYDQSMLKYVTSNIVWGSGTISVDEGTGVISSHDITGSGSATTLVTITFSSSASFMRIWKDLSLQPVHDVTNPNGVSIESLTLHYTSLPDLSWTSGGGGGISVPHPNFAYTFSPIKGDLNNDGTVNIDDLGTEASYYDSPNPTYNLIGDPTIDIFDLVVIASNFWYIYTPPAP
jgi:hypothetical protein